MRAAVGYAVAFVAQWQDLEKNLSSSSQQQPIVIDSALFPEKPNYSTEKPTLFRERYVCVAVLVCMLCLYSSILI